MRIPDYVGRIVPKCFSSPHCQGLKLKTYLNRIPNDVVMCCIKLSGESLAQEEETMSTPESYKVKGNHVSNTNKASF